MSREQETLWQIIIVEFMFLFSVIFAGTHSFFFYIVFALF